MFLAEQLLAAEQLLVTTNCSLMPNFLFGSVPIIAKKLKSGLAKATTSLFEIINFDVGTNLSFKILERNDGEVISGGAMACLVR